MLNSERGFNIFFLLFCVRLFKAQLEGCYGQTLARL